jgi:predicted CXXCH cytochrome family protein
MKLALWTIVMITAMAQMTSASFLEVMTPPAFLSTHNDHIYLVGKTDAPVVEIRINTVKRFEIPVQDGIFHKHIEFGFGLNEIIIRPLIDDRAAAAQLETSIEILSTPYSAGRLEKLYPLFQFHAQREHDQCAQCHKTDHETLSGADAESACIDCHRDFADRTLLHSTLKQEDCATCHNEVTNQVVASVDPSHNPCSDCHADKMKKFDREFIHGPVAGGSCGVCHDPHGSAFSHSLIDVEEVLCFTCHEFGREFMDMPVKHKPFLDGKCGTCHDPHATSHRWVLAKSSENLCFECHIPGKGTFKNHNHPYNIKPRNKKLTSVQLSDSGTLECLSCHNPHASYSEHLLRSEAEDMCLGCHAEKL